MKSILATVITISYLPRLRLTTLAENWLGLLLLLMLPLNATDNVHFYHAGMWRSDPRLRCDQLSTIETWLNGGQTNQSFNTDSCRVGLLSLYGDLNIRNLAEGVPSSVTDGTDTIINDLWLQNPDPNFGNFAINAKFEDTETGLCYVQNFHNGLFLQLHVPVRRLELNEISYVDQTPVGTPLPTGVSEAEWLNFRSTIKTQLETYQIRLSPVHETGFGDFTAEFGWAQNYQHTKFFDFIDTDVRLGLLFPTGRKADVRQAYDLPLGYGGFWGFPLSVRISLGAYEWLTLGTLLDAIFFHEDTRCLRLRTAADQSGPIKLAVGTAKVQRGSVLNTGFYLKTDHIPWGLSLMLGYSYNKGNAWNVLPESADFDYTIVNADPALQSWHMHILNIFVECDFATDDHPHLPYIAFNVDHIFKGQRVFDTSMKGTTLGVNFIWEY